MFIMTVQKGTILGKNVLICENLTTTKLHHLQSQFLVPRMNNNAHNLAQVTLTFN